MLVKIKNLITHPAVLIFTWLVFLLSPLVSYFRFILINNGSPLIVRIKGASAFLYYLPVAVNVFFLGILVFWFFEFIKGRTQKINGAIFALVTAITAAYLLGVTYLNNLEASNYPNYVYSKYGITIAQLELVSFICLFEMVVFVAFYFFSVKFKKLVSELGRNATAAGGKTSNALFEKASLLISVLVVLCLITLSVQSFFLWPNMLSEAKQGFEGKVGKEYKYIEILVESTNNESKIIHPPQGDKWPAIGNQPLIRYFLFPRTLISGALIDSQNFASTIGEAYFAEMVAQDNISKWPIVDPTMSTVVFNESDEVEYSHLEKIFESDKGSVYKIRF